MIRGAMTENGYVRGIEAADPRIMAFKGIPFAAPPVGENRWRAPQPCENWVGAWSAHKFESISIQDTPGLGTDIYTREWHVNPEILMDENCLYLNIWTPAKTAEERLPVLVWYFGGGLQWGYPSEMEFDGERLARRGIIVVTINYRLNVFGFLAHPELTAEQPDTPTNFGYLDQQAGLKWVKRHIALFGGDPDNITIAGQSAGGGSVLAQMACPANDGLFNKAIIQSALIRSPYMKGGIGNPLPLAEAEKQGVEFFDFLGVKTLKEARELDAFYIRDKYAEYAKTHPRMFSVWDNKFIVGDPIEMLMENKCHKVQILAGNTSDEFTSCIPAGSMAEFEQKAKDIFKDKADKFLSYDEAKACVDGRYANVSGIECMVKAVALQNKANGNKEDCYYYCFDADIPGWDNPGNFHSVELWFMFETLAKCWRPFKGAHYDLARMMCNYWANFVKTGNPNGKDADGADMPEWKPYTKQTPCSMVFKTEGPCPDNSGETEFKSFIIDRMKEVL